MGKIVYDFRDGLEPEKLIFKENQHKLREAIYWLLYLLLDWTYACGWYALFHWAYINYEDTAFWVFSISWIVFVLIFIINAIVNLIRNSNKRKLKKLEAKNRLETENNFTQKRNNYDQPNIPNKIEREMLHENEIVPKVL